MRRIYSRCDNPQRNDYERVWEPGKADFRLARIIQNAGGQLVDQAIPGLSPQNPWAWREGLEERMNSADRVILDTSVYTLHVDAELAVAVRLGIPVLALHRKDTEDRQQHIRNRVAECGGSLAIKFASYCEDPLETAEAITRFVATPDAAETSAGTGHTEPSQD